VADTLDLLTLDEAKLALNITNTGQDAELASYITAVSRRIDALTGPVVIRTVTDELHNGGGSAIWPRYTPVASITSVGEYAGTTLTTLTAETNATKTGKNFLYDATLGVIYRRSGGSDSLFPAGRGNLLVTYQAGRYADTASVDPRFKQAAAIFLSHLWRFEQGQGSATFGGFSAGLGIPSFGTPNAVIDLLMDELRPPLVA
jgi:hypothetical protein